MTTKLKEQFKIFQEENKNIEEEALSAYKELSKKIVKAIFEEYEKINVIEVQIYYEYNDENYVNMIDSISINGKTRNDTISDGKIGELNNRISCLTQTTKSNVSKDIVEACKKQIDSLTKELEEYKKNHKEEVEELERDKNMWIDVWDAFRIIKLDSLKTNKFETENITFER